MKTLTLFFFICCLAGTGCKNKPGQKAELVEIDQNIVLARQLTEKQQWTVEDYEKAVVYISNIKEKDPRAFANYLKGEGSGLFARLTDYHRYDSLLVGKNTDQQFEATLPLTNALSRLVRICYNTDKNQGKLVFGKEMIHSMIASLFLNGKSMSLVNTKYPDKEALDPMRKQGWQKAQSGTFEMIYGSLVTIGSESPFYEKEDLVRLAGFLAGYIKQFESFLEPANRDMIAAEIKKIKDSSPYPEIKEEFSRN